MTSPEVRAQIRRYFYAEHWKIGTIARELSVHPDAVRNAIEAEKFKSSQPLRASVVDPYLGFVQQTRGPQAWMLFQRRATASTETHRAGDGSPLDHRIHVLLREREPVLSACHAEAWGRGEQWFPWPARTD